MPITTASIVDIYNRVSQLTKSGTSGYVSQDEFNGIIKAKQLTLEELLIEVEGENEKASDLIAWLKVFSLLTASASGVLTMPADYLHVDTLSLKVGNNYYPVQILQTESVDMTRTSPVRAPDITQNDVNAYWEAGALTMMPEQAMTIRMRYYKQPPDALLVLTPTSDADNDYLAPTAGTELGWPFAAHNLLSYLVLMDYGVEMKQQETFEFAQYGITIEMIKNAPQ